MEHNAKILIEGTLLTLQLFLGLGVDEDGALCGIRTSVGGRHNIFQSTVPMLSQPNGAQC